MSEPMSPQEWKTLYAAAMLESETTQLRHRIETADAVMQTRLKELPGTSSIRSEQTELQSALDYLRRLKDILTSDQC
jgi:hypothetical protein